MSVCKGQSANSLNGLFSDLRGGKFLLCRHVQAARHRDQHKLLSFLNVIFNDDAPVSIVVDLNERFQFGVEVAALAAEPTGETRHTNAETRYDQLITVTRRLHAESDVFTGRPCSPTEYLHCARCHAPGQRLVKVDIPCQRTCQRAKPN